MTNRRAPPTTASQPSVTKIPCDGDRTHTKATSPASTTANPARTASRSGKNDDTTTAATATAPSAANAW